MNDNIKKMADLLKSGNTMLNMACPVCNNPIFRNNKGKIFCPTCNRNVLVVNDSTHQDNIIKKNGPIDKIQNKEQAKRQIELLTKLKVMMYEKLDDLTQKLKIETHLLDIEAYTRVLLNCLEILNKFQFQKEE